MFLQALDVGRQFAQNLVSASQHRDAQAETLTPLRPAVHIGPLHIVHYPRPTAVQQRGQLFTQMTTVAVVEPQRLRLSHSCAAR